MFDFFLSLDDLPSACDILILTLFVCVLQSVFFVLLEIDIPCLEIG